MELCNLDINGVFDLKHVTRYLFLIVIVIATHGVPAKCGFTHSDSIVSRMSVYSNMDATTIDATIEPNEDGLYPNLTPKEVTLIYRINKNSPWISTLMTRGDHDKWSTRIKRIDEIKYMSFCFFEKDNVGNTTFSIMDDISCLQNAMMEESMPSRNQAYTNIPFHVRHGVVTISDNTIRYMVKTIGAPISTFDVVYMERFNPSVEKVIVHHFGLAMKADAGRICREATEAIIKEYVIEKNGSWLIQYPDKRRGKCEIEYNCNNNEISFAFKIPETAAKQGEVIAVLSVMMKVKKAHYEYLSYTTIKKTGLVCKSSGSEGGLVCR